jgi:exosortase A
MHSEPQVELKLAQATAQRQRQAAALIALALAAVLALFAPTFQEIVKIWNRSETFTHGWLVIPAFLYLVWQQRAQLAATPMRPFAPAIVLGGAFGFVWLLGELSSSLTPSFFAMIALVPVAVTAVFGWRWAKVLAFPLAFLFFAVPFGEVFVPALMEWTANFTVLAVQASGVPVYREGQNFIIPSGAWSVVEACSGIRYLIASMVVGALYAWTMYRSPLRRTLFFGASILVPIVANWLRAYMIVMLGHISGNRIAVGVDHLIYGWIFFGVVMLILFAVGSLWREDHLPAQPLPATPPSRAGGAWLGGSWRPTVIAATLMTIVLAAWPVAARLLTQPDPTRVLADAAPAAAAGWSAVDVRLAAWRPQLEAPSREQVLTFEKDGRRVGVYLGFYTNQRQGAELVNSMNQLLSTRKRETLTVASGKRRIEFGGEPLTVNTARLRGPEGTIVAWQWYWLGRSSTSSDALAKWDLAIDRLLGRDDTSAWVTVYVRNPASDEEADHTLARFVAEMGESLLVALHEVGSK